jgi:Peptidase family M23
MTDKYHPFHIPAYNPGPAFKASSHYGYRDSLFEKPRPGQEKKQEFHSGQDYAAPAGTPIPNAASGVVVYSGFNKNLGNVVIVRNDRGDYSLYGHLQNGDRAQLGQRLEEGDTIGAVGQTGNRVKGVHLHYSVIRPEAGAIIEKGPGNGGPIGIHLDGFTTNDPAGLARYLDDYKRAAEIMSGGNTNLTPGALPPTVREIGSSIHSIKRLQCPRQTRCREAVRLGARRFHRIVRKASRVLLDHNRNFLPACLFPAQKDRRHSAVAMAPHLWCFHSSPQIRASDRTSQTMSRRHQRK